MDGEAWQSMGLQRVGHDQATSLSLSSRLPHPPPRFGRWNFTLLDHQESPSVPLSISTDLRYQLSFSGEPWLIWIVGGLPVTFGSRSVGENKEGASGGSHSSLSNYGICDEWENHTDQLRHLLAMTQPSPSDQTTPLPPGQHTGRVRPGWLSPVYHKDSSSAQLFLLRSFNLFKCRGGKIIFPLRFYVLGWDLSLLLLLLRRFSRVQLCETPWTAAHQASPSLGFSRQEHWSGLPLPSPMHESEKWKWSRSVMSDSLRPHGLQPTRLLCPWDFPGKNTGVGCNFLLQPFSSRKINRRKINEYAWHLHKIWGSKPLWLLDKETVNMSRINKTKEFRLGVVQWWHYIVEKSLYSQSYGFSNSHVWMWELDHKEGWGLKNWCFWTVVLEKTLESPLDCKEIKPINPKGNQPWIFIGGADAEAEAS